PLSPTHPPTLFPYTTLFRSAPGQIGRDDLEAVADREAAVALGAVADVDVHPRGRPSRAAREFVQVAARVLHALMDLRDVAGQDADRKSTRLNSSHVSISYAV